MSFPQLNCSTPSLPSDFGNYLLQENDLILESGLVQLHRID